jgi:hypothetical protein
MTYRFAERSTLEWCASATDGAQKIGAPSFTPLARGGT